MLPRFIIIIFVIEKLEQIYKSANGTSILQQSRVACLSFSILRHHCKYRILTEMPNVQPNAVLGLQVLLHYSRACSLTAL
jgi:hypothetical protein